MLQLACPMTRDLIGAHLEWCRIRNLRGSTIYARGKILERLESWLDGPLEYASEYDLADWWSETVNRIAPASAATELSNVKSFFRWLVRERVRVDDPTLRLEAPRLSRRLPRPIADTDLSVALAAAPARIAPWLYAAAYAGLRACEIARLRREDVRDDLDPPVLIVADGKGGKQRLIPIHPELQRVLYPALPIRGWVFARADRKSGPCHPWLISQLANRFLHSIGISATLHQLRHHFGTGVYRVSRDLRLTQELLGHASPVTTAGYAAWAPELAAAAIGALQVLG